MRSAGRWETDAATFDRYRSLPSLCGDSGERRRGCMARVRCPVLVIHGDRRRESSPYEKGVCPSRKSVGGRARHHRRRGALMPQGARSRPVNLLIRAFVDELAPSPLPKHAFRAASAGQSARSICPRRSVSVMPAATWRSRASCGFTLTSDRLAGAHPVTPCWKMRGERPSGKPPTRSTSPAISRTGGTANTSCMSSRRCGAWTRSCSPTS